MNKSERTLSDSEILSILAILARGDKALLEPGPDNTTKLSYIKRVRVKVESK